MTGAMARRYLDEVAKTLRQVPVEMIVRVVDLIYQAYVTGHQVFILGNGGSAATASHFCCDLSKGAVVDGKPRLRVLSLNDNMALLTAYANDMGYECVFVEQMKNLLQAMDLVICITGSGNSSNVVRAIEFANQMGAVTIGFLGFDGGEARQLVSEEITLDNQNYGQVEDLHMFLAHCVSQCFRERVMNRKAQDFSETAETGRYTVAGHVSPGLPAEAPLMGDAFGLGKGQGLKGGRMA